MNNLMISFNWVISTREEHCGGCGKLQIVSHSGFSLFEDYAILIVTSKYSGARIPG
jgi:hypothetical protein